MPKPGTVAQQTITRPPRAPAFRWRSSLPPQLLFVGFAFLVSLVMNAKSSDLDVFFWPAAELAVHGHPLLIYTIHYGSLPNANGPLSVVPLIGVVAVANLLGWSADPPLRDGLAFAVFSVFTLLAVSEGSKLIALGGSPRRRPIFALALCLSVPLWLALASFGHVEIPLELWLTLVALRLSLQGRFLFAGLTGGLVLLTRSACVVSLVCLALLPLAAGGGERMADRVRHSLSFAAGAAAITAAGLAPFAIANRSALAASLLTYRGGLPIGGGSLWVLLAGERPWGALVQRYDAVLFVAASAILVGVELRRSRREPMSPWIASRALAMAACCVPLLAKTTWSYYLADPYVFAVLAACSRPGWAGRRAWLPPALLVAVSMMLAVVGLSSPPTVVGYLAGVISTAALACAVVLIAAKGRRLTGERRAASPP